MRCHLYKKEGKLNPNLLWYISTDIQNGTSQRIFEAVSRQLGSSSRSSAESQTKHFEQWEWKRQKEEVKVLPSSFLKKAKVSGKKEQQWAKDIICLPKEYVSCSGESEIPIPRGKKEKLWLFLWWMCQISACVLASFYIYIYTYIYKCIITIHIIIHILNVNGNSGVGLAKRGSIWHLQWMKGTPWLKYDQSLAKEWRMTLALNFQLCTPLVEVARASWC